MLKLKMMMASIFKAQWIFYPCGDLGQGHEAVQGIRGEVGGGEGRRGGRGQRGWGGSAKCEELQCQQTAKMTDAYPCASKIHSPGCLKYAIMSLTIE